MLYPRLFKQRDHRVDGPAGAYLRSMKRAINTFGSAAKAELGGRG